MYGRALVASSLIFFLCDIFLGLALGNVGAVFRALPGQLHLPVLLVSILTSIVWFVIFRGFIGHIGPKGAFRRVYFFFAMFGFIVGMLGFLFGDTFFVEVIAQTFLYPFGNASAGYLLARRRKLRSSDDTLPRWA